MNGDVLRILLATFVSWTGLRLTEVALPLIVLQQTGSLWSTGLVAGAAGFGLTNLIWSLRELKSVVHLLRTHLVLSHLTLWISLGLLAVVIAIAVLFSLWVFRRSARASMGDT